MKNSVIKNFKSIESRVVLAVIISFSGVAVIISSFIISSVFTKYITSNLLSDIEQKEIKNLLIPITSIIINSVLTAGLIWIYTRQTRVLEDQRDISEKQKSIAEEQISIQKKQQNIMEAEHIPAVNISVSNVSENIVTIHCSNKGTGIAKQFDAEVEFYVSRETIDSPIDHEMGIELVPLNDKTFTRTQQMPSRGERTLRANYKGCATTPQRIDTEADLPQAYTEEIIRENSEQDLKFALYFERFVDPGGGSPKNIPFTDGIKQLREKENINTFGFKIDISYKDIFSNRVEKIH
jgi:predicted nucleic acid-binding protein